MQSNTPKNIHPIFDRLLQRKDKEKLLQQKGVVLWFTGLSGSGKSTIAELVEKQLHQQNIYTIVLDGDNIRSGINSNLGFSPADRQENIRRIAEVAKLFAQNGAVTICSFISPTEQLRQQAQSIIGQSDFKLIYIDTPLAVCESRDPKGLYKKARAGEIPNFTGISAPFDVPKNPFLSIQTENKTSSQAAQEVINAIQQIIK